MKTSSKLTKYYPWLVIALCSLFLFYKYILQVSPSVMATELMATFHVDGAGLGNLAATYFYAYLLSQIFVGPLMDKLSPRNLTACAIALSAIGGIAFATAHTLLMASLARGLIGFGAAFATISYMKMAAVWFKPKQFALVGGLLATAAMAGGMAGQAPLAILIEYVNWRNSLLLVGALGLALAALFFLLVRDGKHNATPELGVNIHPQLRLRDFLQLLKRKSNWLLMFYSGLAFSPVAVFGGLWGTPFLQESYHLSKTAAASLTSMMFLGLAVGGPLLGYVSDRLGKRYVIMVFGILLSMVSMAVILYLPERTEWLAAVCLFLFGFGTGAFMLGFALGKEMNHIALAATVIAFINTGDAVFGAFSEPLVGKLLDVFWDGKVLNGVHYFNVSSYRLALSLLLLYLVGALLCLMRLRRTVDNPPPC